MKKIKEKPAEKIWTEFQEQQNLTDAQLGAFKKYAAILSEWNRDINLTAITNLAGIVRQHFVDSICLRDFYKVDEVKTMLDIGTGAGFPSIPLKIMFPHLKLFLLEVTKKKQKYLSHLITDLGLQDVQIIDLDWRTFLRKTELTVDLFVTRAALSELELCRMFKPACPYKDAKLVYWVSEKWEPHKKAVPFVKACKDYKLGRKIHKLAFMNV